MSRNRNAYQRAAGVYRRYAVVPALTGAVFIAFSLFQQEYLGVMAAFFGIVGVVLLLSAGLSLYNSRRVQQP